MRMGRRFPAALYFYRMTAGDFTQTRKMVMLKYPSPKSVR